MASSASSLRTLSAARTWTLTPRLALLGLVGLALAVRLLVSLTHQGYWGVDGGAYLLSAHAVLTGEQIADFPRPPLAPGWLLVPFVWAAGADIGLKLFAVFASLAILPGFLLLARRFLTPWQTVAATALLLGDWMFAEMFVAGPLPMVAMGFLLIALWGLVELAETGRRRGGLAVALSLPMIALTNQTTAGITAILLPCATLGLLVLHREQWRPLLWRVTRWAVLGLVLCLPLSYWYLAVAPGSEYTRYPGPLFTFWAWINAAYVIAGVATVVLALLAWKGDRSIRALIGFAAPMVPLALFYSFDESVMNILYRSQYLIMVPIYLGGVWLVSRYGLHSPDWRPVAQIGLAVFTPLFLLGTYYQLHVNKHLEMMVSPATAEAVERINASGDQGRIVTNSYSMALYVAALTGQPVAWSQIYSPPPAYVETHRDAVCLFGWTACEPAEAAADLDARYVLVERLWPVRGEEIGRRVPGLGRTYQTVTGLVDPPENEHPQPVMGEIWDVPSMHDPWRVTEQRADWLTPVFEQGTTILYRVETP